VLLLQGRLPAGMRAPAAPPALVVPPELEVVDAV
jgi:hypothetical protein